MIAYLDNSATTPLCPEAREAMLAAFDTYGNPSSLHALGLEAERIVSDARKTILSSLGVRVSSVLDMRRLVFTASGSEADNLALIGSALAKDNHVGKKLITSDSEHPAVLETLKHLEGLGLRIVKIPTPNGIPDYDLLEQEVDRDTILVSFMLVNNETGAVYDLKRISQIAKAKNPNVIVHTDCVQGYMKLKFTAKSLGADMITLSAHKIGGPKGVGALYVNSSLLTAKKLSPIIFGGGQESGFRSGTENTVGIAGFAAAVKSGLATLDADIAHTSALRQKLIDALSGETRFDGIRLNLPKGECAPHILSVGLPNIKSEVMLHSLSSEGVYVSSGSACSSNTGHKSHVLAAFGLDAREIDSTIRVSLSRFTTEDECTLFLDALERSLAKLVRIKSR